MYGLLSRRFTIQKSNLEDEFVDGKWATQRRFPGSRATYFHKAYRRWHNIRARCMKGGSHQLRQPEYVGCTMSEMFSDYQQFATWCHSQIGYKDSFALDKDLLLRGNKVYGEDYCVFLPRVLNNLIIPHTAYKSSGLHAGVQLVNDRFQASIMMERKTTYLGSFETQEEAAQVYTTFKEAHIRRVSTELKDQIDPRAYDALQNFKL